MSGRYYVMDSRDRKSNGNFKSAVRETATILYLRPSNDYSAPKKDQEDRKRTIISLGIIVAFLFFYTIIVMVSNYNL